MTRERTNRRPRQRDSDHELGERDVQWVCIMSIVGLDFGTTKCLGAIWKNEKPLIVGTGIDDSRIPSLVLVLPDGTTLVGSEAQHYRGRYGGGCLSIPGCKRRMETREGLAWASWHAQRHEVAAMVLQYAKGRVENRAGSPISTAVLTVPGCATLSYREALVKAATIAGIKVDRLLGEAVAAALPFIFSPRCPAECTLASVTFGGGTLDIAFMGVDKSIGVVEVLGVAGDPKLGGQDFDDIIVDHIVACNPSARAGQDRLSNAQYEILREVASQIKTDLSFASSATIRLTGLFTAQSSSTRLQDPELTRDAFQKMSQGLLARVERATEKALVDVEWKGGRWHGERLVLLNGGSSRMPAFQDLIRKAFYPCTRIFSGSETSAVDGALMYARILGGENKSFIVMDVLPHPMHLGLAGGNSVTVFPRGSHIPTTETVALSANGDGMRELRIPIFEGEVEEGGTGRTPYGWICLTGVGQSGRDTPRIDLSIHVDWRMRLGVCAIDQQSKKEIAARVESAFASAGARDVEFVYSKHRMAP